MIYKKKEKKVPEGYNVNDFFNQLYTDKELIWMGQNTNHLVNDTLMRDSLIQAAKDKDYCKYPPPEGFPELKQLVLDDLGLSYEEYDIQITAGATESLYLTISTLLHHLTNTISCDPGYLIINNFANRFGHHVKEIPIYNKECNYKLTPELVRENMDAETKLIVLIDPLNPLGTSYTEEEIREFAEIAKENNIYLLHDITYRDFSPKHFLAAKYAPEHTVTIYSFSKIFGMAGLRIGAVISTHDIIRNIRSSVINDLGTNVLSQVAGIGGLKSKPGWIGKIKRITRTNQELIKEAVDKIDGVFLPVYPSNANMMVIDISDTGIEPSELSDYLLKEKKIFIREGTYTSNQFGKKYVRVSYSIPRKEMEIFAKEFVEAIEYLRKE
ncbi:MAG: pyridoxal phosphate-dependent aminotransferase [Methanobacteriaceae archaeon]|nr:pyridoxal phosphate-dependent aminotransferase [Methanobacteriaceae archaeon]